MVKILVAAMLLLPLFAAVVPKRDTAVPDVPTSMDCRRTCAISVYDGMRSGAHTIIYIQAKQPVNVWSRYMEHP